MVFKGDSMMTRLRGSNQLVFSIDFEEKRAWYDGSTIFINDDVMETEIFAKIDEILHNENDQLIEFYYYLDNTYYFIKKKKTINLKNPSEYNWVEYEWFELPDYDVKKFYDTLVNACRVSIRKEIEKKISMKPDVIQSDSTDTENDNWLALKAYEEFSYLRNTLLVASDWMFSVDIVDSIDPKELELWKVYRQKLRDMPKDNSNQPKLYKWLLPLGPVYWKELNARVTDEYKAKNNYSVDSPYLSVSQHFVTIKFYSRATDDLITSGMTLDMIEKQRMEIMLNKLLSQ